MLQLLSSATACDTATTLEASPSSSIKSRWVARSSGCGTAAWNYHVGLPSVRHCTTVAADPADRKTAEKPDIDVAASILQQIAVRKLCDHLKEEAQSRIVLPEQEVVAMVKSFGITASDSKASQVLEALQTSGVVLRYEGKVFIQPEDVAELVVRALPDTVEEATVCPFLVLQQGTYIHQAVWAPGSLQQLEHTGLVHVQGWQRAPPHCFSFNP